MARPRPRPLSSVTRDPAPVFAAGSHVTLERGERSKRARLTGATGVVVDGAATRGWLRVRVGEATLRWHRRDMRPAAPPVARLAGDALVHVLELVDCHRSLAAAARVCHAWRAACRQPSVWHTVDFVGFRQHALGYALHLIDVRARLRTLRVGYAEHSLEDARVLCWLLRECDTRALERARVAAITGMAALFGGTPAHLGALLAMPSLAPARRARVAALLADYRAVVATPLRAPVLRALAEQAPALRDLDLGSVPVAAAEGVRALAAMRALERLRALVKGHSGYASSVVVPRGGGTVADALRDVLPELRALRHLALGGFDWGAAFAVRSETLETLDVSEMSKSVFLAEARCPRLRRLTYSHTAESYYLSGLVPFVWATDLASRQAVRLSMRPFGGRGWRQRAAFAIEPDGYGFPVDDDDDAFRERNPTHAHLRHARDVRAIWEFDEDYDGTGHAKAAAYYRHELSLATDGDDDEPIAIEQLFPVLGLDEPGGGGGLSARRVTVVNLSQEACRHADE